jgi:hypothetical protein
MITAERQWLKMLIFSCMCMAIGAAITWRLKPVEVVTVVEPPIPVATVVKPVSDNQLTVERTTYRICFLPLYWNLYLPAENMYVWDGMAVFLDADGNAIRAYPVEGICDIVRFDIGDLWTSR